MNRKTLSAAALAVVVGLKSVAGIAAPPAQTVTASTQQGVQWHSDLKSAHKQAVAEGKPIMIVFGAEWCGYCKKLEKQTINTPEMSRFINENFVPVHLDLDKEKKIGEILEVESLPCTIVLSPNADLLGRINGYHTPAPYQKNLTAARQLYQPTQSIVPTEGILR
ncbi:thioredoxin family protein [Planctomicrobium sp. SH661]|uniref:thioredoxin family protein n=1 Tax=Planctomicrobium sp. SH661 TaxID=3448124 RepID=UPI003F5B025D